MALAVDTIARPESATNHRPSDRNTRHVDVTLNTPAGGGDSKLHAPIGATAHRGGSPSVSSDSTRLFQRANYTSPFRHSSCLPISFVWSAWHRLASKRFSTAWEYDLDPWSAETVRTRMPGSQLRSPRQQGLHDETCADDDETDCQQRQIDAPELPECRK